MPAFACSTQWHKSECAASVVKYAACIGSFTRPACTHLQTKSARGCLWILHGFKTDLNKSQRISSTNCSMQQIVFDQRLCIEQTSRRLLADWTGTRLWLSQLMLKAWQLLWTHGIHSPCGAPCADTLSKLQTTHYLSESFCLTSLTFKPHRYIVKQRASAHVPMPVQVNVRQTCLIGQPVCL